MFIANRRRIFDSLLREGVSLAACRHDGRVVGMRMSHISGGQDSLTSHQHSQPSPTEDYIRLVQTLLASAGDMTLLMEREPDLKKIFSMLLMTVDPDYRGRGIASNLITCSLEVN